RRGGRGSALTAHRRTCRGGEPPLRCACIMVPRVVIPWWTLIMDKPRIRAATAADVPAIADIVDHAYQHYIARMGKPPGPMLDDYAARVLEGVVWVLEEAAAIAGIIVL